MRTAHVLVGFPVPTFHASEGENGFSMPVFPSFPLSFHITSHSSILLFTLPFFNEASCRFSREENPLFSFSFPELLKKEMQKEKKTKKKVDEK